MKGIILAGGKGSRLYPVTFGTNKQLLPIYNKPAIYYPLSTLMLADIRDILIISSPEDLPSIKKLCKDGSHLGLNIQYAEQAEPNGIAEAFIIGKDFINNDNVCLILGDNIFYGSDLVKKLKKASKIEKGATIFTYKVNDPKRYGIAELDKQNNVLSLEEKPSDPKSNWAVCGLYFYDTTCIFKVSNLKPSARDELEITDLNKLYLEEGALSAITLSRGYAWLDTGTFDSMLESSQFVQTLEKRQGLIIACPEEIAYTNGWITKFELNKLALQYNNEYGTYLKSLV